MEASSNQLYVVAGDAAGVKILEVIPVDRFHHIWKMILSDASTLTAFQNAVRTDDWEWKRILNPKRKLWLFQMVFPFLTKYLKGKDVLKLRQVCRQWSESVDKLIESAHFEFYMGPNSEEVGWNGHVRCPYTITITDEEEDVDELPPLNVDAFIKSMRDHPRNPFVGRGVAIRNEIAYAPTAQLLEQLNKFLPVFGHHLCSLHLNSYANETLEGMYGFIFGVLGQTPNLRQLRLHLGYWNGPEDLANPMEQAEILNLPQLRTFQLDLDHYTGEPGQFTLVYDFIRRHSPQLEKFNVTGMPVRLWATMEWQNLKELYVDVASAGIMSALVNMKATQLAQLTVTNYSQNTMKELQRVLRSFPSLEASKMVFQ